MLDAAQAQLTAGRLDSAQLLDAHLAPDLQPLRLQVEIAVGLGAAACCAPLQGQPVPALGKPAGRTDQPQLPATDFVQRFAWPDFFFYMSCAGALMRHVGVPLIKKDFGGLHRYR